MPVKKHEIRRRFVETYCRPTSMRILEIGALDEPTYPELRVRYLDWFSADELRAQHNANRNRNAQNIVDVDYVITDKRFSKQVRERFDLVIANHVLEHVADPLVWFDELYEITAPGGHIFLSVPDRGFTFDYLRPVSTVVDLLRASSEDLERPDKWQILSALYYWRPLRTEDFWETTDARESKLANKRFPLGEAVQVAERHAARGYADVHCFVYSHDTFAALAEGLAETDMFRWRLRGLQPVLPGTQEFHVWLARQPCD